MATSIAQPERPELLDVEAVASTLGVSTRLVYRMADSARMPRPVKIGRLVRWRRQDVLDWIEQGCPAVGRKAVSR